MVLPTNLCDASHDSKQPYREREERSLAAVFRLEGMVQPVYFRPVGSSSCGDRV